MGFVLRETGRRLFIHIGTHKTGSTALQLALGRETASLAERGFLVPAAGRGLAPDVGSHHAIVGALVHDAANTIPGQTLTELLAELARCELPHAVISSENFSCLYTWPAALQEIAEGVASIGYAVTIVAYVREQSAFVESLYAELVKHGCAWDFDAYLARAIARATIELATTWHYALDYAYLAGQFESAFGAGAVVIRPYPTPGASLLRDFWDTLGIAIDAPGRTREPAADVNARSAATAVLERLQRNAQALDAHTATLESILATLSESERKALEEPFAPLGEEEITRIAARFAAPNAELRARYGSAPPTRSGRSATATAALQRRVLRRASAAWRLGDAVAHGG